MSTRSFAIPIAKEEPSTCGYCSPPGQRSEDAKNYKVAGLLAMHLSCEVGTGIGHQRATCTKGYHDVLSPHRWTRQWNRHILQGEGDMDAASAAPKKQKGRDNQPFNLIESLHSAEEGFLQETRSPPHKLQVTLEPSTYTAEKFQLYRKYQRDVHKEDEKSVSGFKRFLVESPLVEEPIAYATDSPPDHLPKMYGSYHQLYRVDGKLVAMAVLDILPNCVSSVYFMYDVLWDHYSLGKLSALREVSLAKEIHDAGVPNMKFLYLGYYVYSCRKMRYKGEYSPSFLADPETYAWYPLETCIPLLEKNRYACFSDPSHCIEDEALELPDSPEPDLNDLEDICVIVNQPNGERVAVPIPWTNAFDNKKTKEDICAVIEGLGLALAGRIFWMGSF
ncbi:arginine-tRNA-protein transferase 1 [Coprinellus micaceus]|uniref:Arginyl-tRNA--protein transferase 1 n=1 Tax=Coprinellus micaceus TaxID=71717 RepID=A0A4Y7T7J5_COPMI|nr:arginine-tRNA-protein transferase 1 [Coprinellus micaceus]